MVDVIILVEFQTSLDLCFDLLGEKEFVNQFSLYVIIGLGKGHNAVASQFVQLFRLHLTTFCHLLQPVVPDARQVGGTLFTVVFAHPRLGVALYITLIFAHFGNKVFDTQFVVESFIVFTLAA